ncbi:hypothetical protein QCA50_020024 [Cerrena zonata]|uniref:Copper transport protein n=1 Tax=Cerrena zonata TaxID=2478898 RepID=A0AAW0F896_9APHY
MLSTIFLLSLIPSSLCHENGMDMSMDGAMSLASGQMLMWFHFTPGDNLWFEGWVPQSAGAMVGTCIGLFLLALVDRWIGACRGMMEMHWARRAQILKSDRLNHKGLPTSTSEKTKSAQPQHAHASTMTNLTNAVMLRDIPPFILAHDSMRGIIHAGQAALQFAFMLAAMTFQLGFIFSIVVGLGVGETLFGRFASHAAHMA